MTHPTIQVARDFARALDEEDYAKAFALLSPDCTYVIGDSKFTGPQPIVDEYRRNGDGATERFDSIAYESDVEADGQRSAIITFIDDIRHDGHRLRHTCEQRIDLGEDGLIRRIEHRDLPGEPEALQAFYRKIGLAGGE